MPPVQVSLGSLRHFVEARETERALALWLRCAMQFGGRPPTPTVLDIERIATKGWEYRFAIAGDAVPEDSALLTYGANFARLLDLPRRADFSVPLFHQLPEQTVAIFAAGCRDAALKGEPVRSEGAIIRRDGRRQFYRAIFMPVGVNLIFGAFNSRLDHERPLLAAVAPLFGSVAARLRHLARAP
jgi:hypothetical protein